MLGITRGAIALLLTAALVGAAIARPPAARAAEEECFAETGFCLRGAFLAYWRAHGGLAINGYPLSNPRVETLEDGRPYTVQYFERTRLEYHPENAADYRILLGQFGRRIRPADPPLPKPNGPLPADRVYFAETGHFIAGPFFNYWLTNGGLPQFGYPLGEEFTETIDGKSYTVQYFERARFERHPENQPPYDVLLGQFGRRILAESSPLQLPPCAAANLSARTAGDAGAGSRFATVFLTNTGPAPCALVGAPQVQLLDGAGNPLSVVVRTEDTAPVDLVALPSGLQASFGLRWTNWCGPDPGGVGIRATLPQGGGDLTTGGIGVPPCLGEGQASTLGITPFTVEGPAGGANTVLRFYNAVNARDYRAAYALLGDGLRAGQSYDAFAAGYANTRGVAVTIAAINGTTAAETLRIAVQLVATLNNGGSERFAGTYDVGPENGALRLVAASVAPGP